MLRCTAYVLFTLLCMLARTTPGRCDPPPVAGGSAGWIGIEGDDPLRPGAADPKRLAFFRDVPRLLVRSKPVTWEQVMPLAPVAGRRLHDWEALDRWVVAWQDAGHEPVVVLDPRSTWAGTPAEACAFFDAARQGLGEAGAELFPFEAGGATPPRAERWDEWQAFVQDVVERYDADGRDDAPGLARPLAWLQIMDRPMRPSAWLGSGAEYARLLHTAELGARKACQGVRIAHGGVDLMGWGRAGAEDGAALLRAVDAQPGWGSRADRFLATWSLRESLAGLELSEVYGAVGLVGAAHLEDERQDLAGLERLLRSGGQAGVERWLIATPAEKVAAPRSLPGGPSARERQLRARWLATARRTGHTEQAQALAWLDSGRAYDVVRTLALGRLAGADRVFLGRPSEAAPVGDGPLGVLLEPGGRARSAGWALAQAARLLASPRAVGTWPVAGPARCVRFDRDPEARPAWVAVVVPDPDRSWAGDPREEVPPTELALHLTPGRYRIVEVRRDAAEAPHRDVDAPDGVLGLALGPEPVYVLPLD